MPDQPAHDHPAAIDQAARDLARRRLRRDVQPWHVHHAGLDPHRDRAAVAVRLHELADQLYSLPTKWIIVGGVGGYVCAVPDAARPDGICGMPVESEPCTEHQPTPDARALLERLASAAEAYLTRGPEATEDGARTLRYALGEAALDAWQWLRPDTAAPPASATQPAEPAPAEGQDTSSTHSGSQGATVRPTEYEISVIPETDINHSAYAIKVAYRGGGRWAVTRSPWCLGVDGVWGFETRPSEREDQWLAAHRFDLDTALRLAAAEAPNVVVNGTSAQQVADRHGRDDQEAGTLTRRCSHPGCTRTYQADTGPREPGWLRLQGLTVICPDHQAEQHQAGDQEAGR